MMRPLMLAVTAIWFFAQTATAQFDPGNLAIYRVGTGAAALTNAGTATFVDRYDNAGTLLGTISIDATGASRLTNSGTATSEGAFVRSTNGLFLAFGGYDADAGTAGIAATTAAANPRVIGTIDASGGYTRVGNFGTNYSANNIRGAIFDASRAWSVGANSGVVSNVGGTVSTVSTTNTNNRVVNIFSDQLYISTGAGTTRGIWAVGTGTPTGAGVTSVNVIATGAASSPYAFQANTTGDVVYIADDSGNATGGIQKWTWNGSAWTQAYVLGTGATNIGARGLTVDWSNPSAPIIYATSAESSANRLIKIIDTGAGSAASTLATAGTNTAFRGVEQTLLPATWTAGTSGNWLNSNTSTSGFGNQYSNWSVGLSNGINLAFQKVNAANVTASNNSGLNGISSITFTGAGFGSQNTQYTLTGNGIFLTGTTATGQGVKNNSGVTQTVNLNLSVSGPQTFNAASGDLVFGGSLSLFTNPLTVTGPSNTSISGVVSGGFGGSITKTGMGTLTLSNTNTYDGGTMINGGTVVATATNATGTGATTINTGGTLRSGATLAEIVVNSGGRIAPGASPGTLNSGKGTLNGGGMFEFEINDATGVAGTNWDLWNTTVSDGLTLNATSGNQFNIDIPNPQVVANFDPTQNYSWQFMSFAGAIQGAGFDPNAFNVLFSGPFAGNGTFNVSQVGNGLFLNFSPSPVPEPSTMLLIGAVGAAFVVYRRRGKI